MTSTLRQSKLIKFMHDKDSLWNSIPYELKCKGEIECYDKVMELYPNYFTIWFILGLGYKLKAKEYFRRSKLSNKTKREIK